MNKIKFFVLSLVAACVAMSFTACKNGEETITERIVTKTDTITKEVKTVVDNNWSRYQDIVNQDVNDVESHAIIKRVIARDGEDYRFETAPNPVAALRDRRSDNTAVGRVQGTAC
jgi:hypothetical protein